MSFGRASTRVTEDPMWVYEEALSRFRVHAQGLVKRMVKANGLEGTWKVAALLIGTNLAPQSPKQTTDLRMIDFYIIENVRRHSPFLLPSLLIFFLRDIACSPMAIGSLVSRCSFLVSFTTFIFIFQENFKTWPLLLMLSLTPPSHGAFTCGIPMREGGAQKLKHKETENGHKSVR